MNQTVAGKDSLPLDERQVVEYLQEHPDFFQQHEQLLPRLEIPDVEAGTASSLLLRQVANLRQQLAELQCQEVLQRQRHENWQGMTEVIFRRLVMISDAGDPAALYTILRESLYSLFSASRFRFYVFSELPDHIGPLYQYHARPHRIRNLMSQVFNVGRPLIDSLQSEYLHDLFAEDAELIHASYLLPVTHPHWEGLLVLGSSDYNRYSHGPELEALRCLLEVSANRLDVWMR